MDVCLGCPVCRWRPCCGQVLRVRDPTTEYGIEKLTEGRDPTMGCRAIITITIIIIITQVSYYLCAEPTATRPVTDTQCRYRTT
jgi:hypothetical protein